MAEKRSLSKKVIDSDRFLDMSLQAQALYFHMSMRADDWGFINCSKKIQRMVCATKQHLEELINNEYIIMFESGIAIITHWHVNNTIRADRKGEIEYVEEMEQLISENGVYKLKNDKNGEKNNENDEKQVIEQKEVKNEVKEIKVEVKEVKKEIKEEVNEVKEEKEKKIKIFIPPSVEDVKKYCSENNYNVDAERFIDFYECKGWMVGKNKMKCWKSAVRNWHRTNDTVTEVKIKPKIVKTNMFNAFPQRNYSEEQLKNLEKKLLTR
jgi:hypothetical protein